MESFKHPIDLVRSWRKSLRAVPPSPADPAERRGPVAPLLLLLFFGSGCAALIYEIVWFQLLEFVIGSTAISLAVLLGTFMGGMCLGSLTLPRLVSERHHPLRVCAVLELGIGAMGAAVLMGMPFVVRLFGGGGGHDAAGILVRGAICALCLLPPTVLMGATLPAISRWLKTTPSGISWLGLFYGSNTVGAVFGCLLAGFYLLRVHDMATATRVAAAINLAAALLGFALAARAPFDAVAQERPGERLRGSKAVHLAIAFSGMSALGAEVVWTRLLSLVLGPTVYTFSIILAVFLLGLALGGSAGGLLSRVFARPRALFIGCQALLAVAIAWAAHAAVKSLPYWTVHGINPWHHFQMDFLHCLLAILPAAVLWGASFPLAVAAAARPGRDPGRLVGGIYAANTLGAIAGAVAFSLLIIPWAGTQWAERSLIGLAAAAALLLLPPLRRTWIAGWIGAAALAAAALIATVPRTPGLLVAYGHSAVQDGGATRVLYMGEGMNASVAVSETTDNVRQFHVSGKVEASTTPQDMRLQRMLSQLPAMLHPRPRSVLIVGCGAGVTAGWFVVQPGIKRIVICEIEPLVPKVVARYFSPRTTRGHRSARRNRLRRRPPLHPHDEGEVRHHHLRSDPPVGQGLRLAVHPGVFRNVQGPPEPRRHGHPVGPALRKRRSDGDAAKSRHSFGSSRAERSGPTTTRAAATTRSFWARTDPRTSTWTASGTAGRARPTGPPQPRSPRWVSPSRRTCWRPMRAGPPNWAPGWRMPRSTATATFACSTSRGSD